MEIKKSNNNGFVERKNDELIVIEFLLKKGFKIEFPGRNNWCVLGKNIRHSDRLYKYNKEFSKFYKERNKEKEIILSEWWKKENDYSFEFNGVTRGEILEKFGDLLSEENRKEIESKL